MASMAGPVGSPVWSVIFIHKINYATFAYQRLRSLINRLHLFIRRVCNVLKQPCIIAMG